MFNNRHGKIELIVCLFSLFCKACMVLGWCPKYELDVGDPGLDVGQGAGHLLLGLTEHLPGVPFQLLRTHNIDRVRDNEHCG